MSPRGNPGWDDNNNNSKIFSFSKKQNKYKTTKKNKKKKKNAERERGGKEVKRKRMEKKECKSVHVKLYKYEFYSLVFCLLEIWDKQVWQKWKKENSSHGNEVPLQDTVLLM